MKYSLLVICSLLSLAVSAHVPGNQKVGGGLEKVEGGLEKVEAGLGKVEMLTIYAKGCPGCGMTNRGKLNIEICGGDSCCHVTDLAKGDSDRFPEDWIDRFSGANIDDCDGFDLMTDENLVDFSMTLTHEGEDDLVMDWWQIVTDLFTVGCNGVLKLEGDNSYDVTNECQVYSLVKH